MLLTVTSDLISSICCAKALPILHSNLHLNYRTPYLPLTSVPGLQVLCTVLGKNQTVVSTEEDFNIYFLNDSGEKEKCKHSITVASGNAQ